MKALRSYGGKDIRYEDVPEPSAGPGQVKARITLAGICGSDLKKYLADPHSIPISMKPLIVGHEFSGRVVEVGEGVTGFKVGDRVTGEGYRICGECYYCKRFMYNLCLNQERTGGTVDGCMAEYLVAPSYSFYKLPDSVSDEAGALVEPLSVALHGVRQGKVHLGDTVAIVGDGTIGLCTLLAARAAGSCEIYVVSKHKHRGEAALSMGATAVISLSDGHPIRQIWNLTGGLGVDVSFDCAGRQDTPRISAELARSGGTMIILADLDKPVAFNFNDLVLMEKSIIGSFIYVGEAKTAIAMLADGRINSNYLTSLITSKVPLRDAVEMGFEQLINNKEGNQKILLQIPSI